MVEYVRQDWFAFAFGLDFAPASFQRHSSRFCVGQSRALAGEVVRDGQKGKEPIQRTWNNCRESVSCLSQCPMRSFSSLARKKLVHFL